MPWREGFAGMVQILREDQLMSFWEWGLIIILKQLSKKGENECLLNKYPS